jgi:primosomal protein N' (replication factor Y) (superfamily II helicase)
MAAVRGSPDTIASFLLTAELPAAAELLGPVPEDDAEGTERALIRIGRDQGGELAQALHTALARRSAHKEGGGIRVQLDPGEVI